MGPAHPQIAANTHTTNLAQIRSGLLPAQPHLRMANLAHQGRTATEVVRAGAQLLRRPHLWPRPQTDRPHEKDPNSGPLVGICIVRLSLRLSATRLLREMATTGRTSRICGALQAPRSKTLPTPWRSRLLEYDPGILQTTQNSTGRSGDARTDGSTNAKCLGHSTPGLGSVRLSDAKHTPLQVVSLWHERLLREAADLWVLPSMYIPRSITLEIEDVIHQVQVQHPTTAYELVRAESDLAGWGHRVKLYEGQRELHGLTLLHHNHKYHVELSTKRQRVALQQNQCEVYLHELQHIRVPQGTFIMHVLTWLGATTARHEGRALPPGSRIWTCLALEISGAGYQGQKCSDESIYGTLQALLKLSNNLGNTPWTALSPREAKILEVAPPELLTQADTFRQTLNFTEKLILVFEDEGHWAVLLVTLEENGLKGKVLQWLSANPTGHLHSDEPDRHPLGTPSSASPPSFLVPAKRRQRMWGHRDTCMSATSWTSGTTSRMRTQELGTHTYSPWTPQSMPGGQPAPTRTNSPVTSSRFCSNREYLPTQLNKGLRRHQADRQKGAPPSSSAGECLAIAQVASEPIQVSIPLGSRRN